MAKDTKSGKPRAPRKNIDYDAFVEAWLASDSFSGVVQRLGLASDRVQEIYLICIRKGLELKRLLGQPQRGGRVDWDALKAKVNGN